MWLQSLDHVAGVQAASSLKPDGKSLLARLLLKVFSLLIIS